MRKVVFKEILHYNGYIGSVSFVIWMMLNDLESYVFEEFLVFPPHSTYYALLL